MGEGVRPGDPYEDHFRCSTLEWLRPYLLTLDQTWKACRGQTQWCRLQTLKVLQHWAQVVTTSTHYIPWETPPTQTAMSRRRSTAFRCRCNKPFIFSVTDAEVGELGYSIEIGVERAPFVVFVYFFSSFQHAKNLLIMGWGKKNPPCFSAIFRTKEKNKILIQ